MYQSIQVYYIWILWPGLHLNTRLIKINWLIKINKYKNATYIVTEAYKDSLA